MILPKHFRRYTALLLLLAAATTAAVAHSASSNAYGDRAMENLAIALVIDTSASMSYTDPGRLRETAADMFIDLLGPLDRLAIITFDQKVHRVVPLQQLGGAASQHSGEDDSDEQHSPAYADPTPPEITLRVAEC